MYPLTIARSTVRPNWLLWCHLYNCRLPLDSPWTSSQCLSSPSALTRGELFCSTLKPFPSFSYNWRKTTHWLALWRTRSPPCSTPPSPCCDAPYVQFHKTHTFTQNHDIIFWYSPPYSFITGHRGLWFCQSIPVLFVPSPSSPSLIYRQTGRPLVSSRYDVKNIV